MIPMQQDCLNNVRFLVGNVQTLDEMGHISYTPFSDNAIDFLDSISKALREDEEGKKYSDIQAFAIWVRKSSVLKMKASYVGLSNRIGRGITFHIAPSNMPLLFMFSFAVSLLAGNPNIIRLSSKDSERMPILLHAISRTVKNHPDMKNLIVIVKYGHEKQITDYFSAICRTRMIWGGDMSVKQIRRSELPVSAIDIPFYDRFSLAIIESDGYLAYKEKERVAERFYNDTYVTDQNACTSPQLVVWAGKNKEEARRIFWEYVKSIVDKKYDFQSIQAVDKIVAAARIGATGIPGRMIDTDMKLVRIELEELLENLKDYRCPGGYFYEYLCEDLSEIRKVCGTDCQTISYFGLERKDIVNILRKGNCTGVDRIVPIGATMNFGLQWDGYDFIHSLSRIVG